MKRLVKFVLYGVAILFVGMFALGLALRLGGYNAPPQSVTAITTPSKPPSAPSVLAEIGAFLRSHPEFGEPVGTFAVPDWAEGKRQRVRFASGKDLLFYTKNDSVMTIYEDVPGTGRKIVWGETAK